MKEYEKLLTQLRARLNAGESIYYRIESDGSYAEFPEDKQADPLFVNRFMKRDNRDYLVKEYSYESGVLVQKRILNSENIREIMDLIVQRNLRYEKLQEEMIERLGMVIRLEPLRK